MSYTMEVNVAKNQVIVRAYGLTEGDVPAYIADFESALKQKIALQDSLQI